MKRISFTKRPLALGTALILLLGGIMGAFLLARPTAGGDPSTAADRNAYYQRLAATPYQTGVSSGAPLQEPGLSDPWKLGVDKEAFEKENLYPVPADAEVIRLTDYKADAATDKSDDTLALAEALEAVRAKEGAPTVLELPAGDLDFIEGMNPVDPAYAIVIDGIDNLTIRGNDTNLYFHGTFKAFHVSNCKNFQMNEVNIDWGRVPFSMGTILETDGTTFTVKVDKGYPVDGNTEIMGLLEFNPKTNVPLVNGNDIYYTVQSVRLVAPQTLKIKFSNKYKASAPGTTVILRHQIYSYDAVTCDAVDGVTMENVNIYSAPGMGVLAKECSDIRMNRMNVMLRPGTDRLMSVTADAVHLMETAGEVTVTNSLFENCGDDALNVHGFYQTVKSITSDRRAVYAVNDRNYNFKPGRGDRIEVCNRSDLSVKATMTVEAAAPNTEGGGASTSALPRRFRMALRSATFW